MEVVLIECEDLTTHGVVAKSGFKFSDGHVITVGSLLFSPENRNFEKLIFFVTSRTLRVRANVVTVFESESVKSCAEELFGEWSLDSSKSASLAQTSLYLFLVLSLDLSFKCDLSSELGALKEKVRGGFSKGSEVLVESVPFGNKHFIGNQSCGIVSNVLGKDGCFVLSDCPTVPGSEGSPMFLKGR